MGKEIPEDIKGPGAAKPIKPVEEGAKTPTQSFESFMKEGTKTGEAGGKPSQVSPMDLPAGKGVAGAPPTMDSVLSQMNSTSGVLGDVQNQLNTKNLKLKQSQKYLLRNKLTESNSQIRAASAKVGVNVGEPPSMMSKQNPIAKFLSLVNDSSIQMENSTKILKNMKSKGDALNPGDLLLVQVKLNKAQQEMEYTSVLLSQAVGDIKLLFNVQI